MRVSIDWDLETDDNPDGERLEDSPPEVVELSEEEVTSLQEDSEGDPDDFLDGLVDYLSECYGFCVHSATILDGD